MSKLRTKLSPELQPMPDSSPFSCRAENRLATAHPLFERLVEAADRANDHQHSASSYQAGMSPGSGPNVVVAPASLPMPKPSVLPSQAELDDLLRPLAAQLIWWQPADD
jgi:hypothetical protein